MAIGADTLLDTIVFWGSIGMLVCVAAGIWNIVAIFLGHRERISAALTTDIAPKKGWTDKYFPTVKKGGKKLLDKVLKREKGAEAGERGVERVEAAAEDVEARLRVEEAREATEEGQSIILGQRIKEFSDAINARIDRIRALHAEDVDLAREETALAGKPGQEARLAAIRAKRAALRQEIIRFESEIAELSKNFGTINKTNDQVERDISGRLKTEVNLANQGLARNKEAMKLLTMSRSTAAAEEAELKAAARAAHPKERAEIDKLILLVETREQHHANLETKIAEKEKLEIQLKKELATKEGLTEEIMKILTPIEPLVAEQEGFGVEQMRLSGIDPERRSAAQEKEIEALAVKMKIANEKIAKANNSTLPLKVMRAKITATEERLIAEIGQLDTQIREMEMKIRHLDAGIKKELEAGERFAAKGV